MVIIDNNPRRRRYDHSQDSCPMTPEQIRVMLATQEQLMLDIAEIKKDNVITKDHMLGLRADNSEIKKYLFAGRVVIGTLVFIGLTLDWTRDHVSFLKSWLASK